MPRSHRSTISSALALATAITAVMPAESHALWGRDGVRLVSVDVGPPVACPDGSGGVYAFWLSWPGDVRAIRFRSDATIAPGWPSSGLVVAAYDFNNCFWQNPHLASSDGLGGAIVGYRQNCFGGFSSEWFSRVDPGGSVHAGWPRTFDTGVRDAYRAGAADEVGGVVGAWIERMTSNDEPVWVQRLGQGGEPAWPKQLLSLENLAWAPSVASDGAGGAIVGWPCRVVQVDSSGAGVQDFVLPSCGANVPSPEATSDGAGGAFVAWSNGINTRVLRVTDGDVAPGWPAAGVTAGSASSDLGGAADFAITSDLQGGVFVTWTESSGTKRVQRVTGSGAMAPGWPASGIPRRGNPVPDGDGGVYFVWGENQTGQVGGVDLFAQHILADGSLAPGWLATGSPICLAPDNQGVPFGVSDGAGGFYATWSDSGLYAQRVGSYETIPLAVGPRQPSLGLAIAAPRPNPVRGPATCVITLPEHSSATLELFDVFGRRLASLGLSDAGAGSRSVPLPTSGLRPGVYTIRLAQASRSAITRFVVAR